MCGRYTLSSGPEEVAELVKGKFNYPKFGKSYNIAPSQHSLIVTLKDDVFAGELAYWGLIPVWMKDPKKPFINARAETVLEKPSFKYLYKNHRCVVPADGFYEWEAVAGKKRPVYFHLPARKPFAFAGFWEKSREHEGEKCFVVMTTEANDFMRPVHDRMPVMLDRDGVGRWLRDGDMETLVTPPNELLEADRVSTMVNSPANNNHHCIEPFDYGDAA